MKRNKAFKFRLYPTHEQEIFFNNTFGCCRFVYNKMLAERKESYESTGESTSRTPAELKAEFPFLKEVDSCSLANEWMNLNKAYGNFFRNKRVGFPQFKSKKNDRKSYKTFLSKTKAFDTSGKFVKLPKIGLVRCKICREIPSDWKIKSATISQSPTGKFYVSILCEYETEIRPVTPDRNNAIGIDYKSNGFGVTSEGETLSNHRYFRENQSKLSREQRRLSRKKKNSKNFKKQKKVLFVRVETGRLYNLYIKEIQNMCVKSMTIALDYDTEDTYQEILDKFKNYIVTSDYDKNVSRGDEITINIIPGAGIHELLEIIYDILDNYDYLYPRVLFTEELDARNL